MNHIYQHMIEHYRLAAQAAVEAAEHGHLDMVERHEREAGATWNMLEKLIGRDELMKEVF